MYAYSGDLWVQIKLTGEGTSMLWPAMWHGTDPNSQLAGWETAGLLRQSCAWYIKTCWSLQKYIHQQNRNLKSACAWGQWCRQLLDIVASLLTNVQKRGVLRVVQPMMCDHCTIRRHKKVWSASNTKIWRHSSGIISTPPVALRGV